jgi:hypothetical protein
MNILLHVYATSNKQQFHPSKVRQPTSDKQQAKSNNSSNKLLSLSNKHNPTLTMQATRATSLSNKQQATSCGQQLQATSNKKLLQTTSNNQHQTSNKQQFKQRLQATTNKQLGILNKQHAPSLSNNKQD